MKPAARPVPLLLLPLLALAALPAAAQPGASWTETGDVTILVYAPGGGVRFGREAADVLDSDIIDEITVGKSGTVATQKTGTLTIEGVGTVEAARDLGDVFVLVGLLELNDVFVDGRWIRIGSTIDTALTDPSTGTLSVTLSEVSSDVTVRRGTLTCQASLMGSVTVLDDGYAQISGCSIGYITGDGLSETSIDISTIQGASFRGTTNVSSSTLHTTNATAVEGDITIGATGAVSWDDAGAIVIGQNALATNFTVANSSTVAAQTTEFRGGGATHVVLQAASTWRSFGLLSVQSALTTLDVNSASRIDARSDLWIGSGAGVTVRSGVGTDSRIDVAGNLGVGQFNQTGFGPGTLTIEDGGVVDVAGTLYIAPAATVNLDGGTLRVTNLVQDGTLNENGGTLIVPEAGATASTIAAMLAVVRMRRSDWRKA